MFTAVGDLLAAGSLTESEFLQWMYAMMIAGFETTHTVIGQSTRMYLEDSEVRRLTDQAVDEGRSMRAVEEYIRLISPAMHMARMATTDTEIAGQPIKRDDVMVLYYLAANRDPAVYSEPHRFDPARSETATIPFGSDVHYCIGAHLAKLELRILLEELRAARLDPELNGTPKRGWSVFINQLTALPVARRA